MAGIDPKRPLSSSKNFFGIKSVDWKKWAAIAEIVGTFAVVISLIFVGISIQKNTAVVQAEQQNLLYELTDDWLSDQVSHPELYDIQFRATNRQALTDIERARFSDQVYRALNVWENAQFKNRNGLLTDEQYRFWHNANVAWVECCVPRWVWKELDADEFHPEFVSTVDAIFDSLDE